jgi:Sap, sulfolipid-1-addressing protein
VNIEIIVLGLFSGLRPGTSLAAVLVLLKTSQPRQPMFFFTVAGLVSAWVIGMLVVGVFHGANVAIGGSTFAAVIDIALGAAALGFAAGLQQGWVEPRLRRDPSEPARTSRIGPRLRNPSARVAAAAGVGTHLPGLLYLVALNAIASERPGPVSASLRVAIYDALWFVIPLASLALVVARPGVASAYLEAATAWVRRHQHAVLVTGSLALGGYLLVDGVTSLLA